MIGNKLRFHRLSKGYSQEYIANLLNISQSSYSAIENNKIELNLNRIESIAKILETNLLELLEKEPNTQKINTEDLYSDYIKSLKEEIIFLRKQLQIKEL